MSLNELGIKGLDLLINLLNNNFNSFKVGSARFWTNTGWMNAPGKRKDFEIFYFVSGSVDINIGSIKTSANEGDIFVIDNFYGNSCSGGQFEMFYIQFVSSEKADGDQLRRQICETMKAMPQKINLGKSATIQQTCENISFEFSTKQAYYGTRAKTLFLDLLIQLHRIYYNKNIGSTIQSIEKYKNELFGIVNYLSENLTMNHTLADLSKMLGLSERYFNLLFRKFTGYPAIQYHQRLKIDKAKRMLESSNLSMTEIAFELGFDSSQYFSKIFKKVTSITPSRYRDQCR
jgi:Transcriptional regulator containing an amidase domain and an AraC-type DNA-binding HTH domain